MHQVGIESTIQVFERAKTVHDLDRATTVLGSATYKRTYFERSNSLVDIVENSALLYVCVYYALKKLYH
jgi:hypothetical protein